MRVEHQKEGGGGIGAESVPTQHSTRESCAEEVRAAVTLLTAQGSRPQGVSQGRTECYSGLVGASEEEFIFKKLAEILRGSIPTTAHDRIRDYKRKNEEKRLSLKVSRMPQPPPFSSTRCGDACKLQFWWKCDVSIRENGNLKCISFFKTSSFVTSVKLFWLNTSRSPCLSLW